MQLLIIIFIILHAGAYGGSWMLAVAALIAFLNIVYGDK